MSALSFDRKDFTELNARNEKARTQSRLPFLRSVAAAAPKMEALTHDTNWDQYLHYLGGVLEKLRAAKDASHRQLENPKLTDSAEIMRIKTALHISDAMIQAIVLATDLPKAIIEGGQSADKLIKEFEQSLIDR